MINPLEKTKLAGAEQARPKTEREQSPKVPGGGEAGLDKLAEEVGTEIKVKQADVLASADKRIESAPASVGVSQEKAEVIYASDGFAERVKSIKERIAALTEATKEKTDLLRLRLQGVKNPESVLAIAHYLEGFAVESESHYLDIEKSKGDKIEKEAEKYRKQGYEVEVFEHYEDKTKMTVGANKEIPYSFSAGKSKLLARDIDTMVGSKNDPVKMLEALRDAGYNIAITKGYTFKDDYRLKELSKNPNALSLLEKLKTFGGSGVVHDFGKGGADALSRLSQLATKDATEHIFTPEAEKGIEKVSALLGKPIQLNMLESWARLSKDPVLLEILTALTQKQIDISKDPYEESSLLYKLEAFKEAGVENEVATLLKDGFSEKLLGKFHGWGEVGRKQAAKDLRTASKAFETNPELQRLVREVDRIFGMEDREQEILSQKNIQGFQQLAEKVPTASLAFANLADMGLHGDRYQMNLERLLGDNPENALAYREVLEVAAEPDFKVFVAACEKTGYQFNLKDFFNGRPGYNRLVSNYRDKSFRSAIESESGVALAKYLRVFETPSSDWDGAVLGRLAEIPDALSTLQKLNGTYGYRYDIKDSDSQYGSTSLIRTLTNEELCKKLLEQKTVDIFNRVKTEFGISFQMGIVAEEIVEMSENPTLQQALQDPETLAFAKNNLANSGHVDIATVVALMTCDITLRSTIKKTVQGGFGYAPRGTYEIISEYDDQTGEFHEKRELRLVDLEKFATLRDEPKIFEIQERLAAIGMSLDPLYPETMERLRIIYEKNLFPIFEQYKDSLNAQRFLWSNLDIVVSLATTSPEKIPVYMEIFQKIDDSPSQEIQRLKDQLLSQLLQSERPVEDYMEIENIFIKNNIPIVGKVFNIFEVLHDRKQLDFLVKGRGPVSPVLAQASPRRRSYTIYQDLLNIHIESGNRSLKEYVEVLQSGSKVLDRYEHSGLESLSAREQEQLLYFTGKLETLLSKSALDTAEDAFKVVQLGDLGERIQHIRKGLKVAEGQTVLERISEMYLRPAGMKNLNDILEKMREVKKGADERSRIMVTESLQKSNDGKAILQIKEGDLLKGVDAQYISLILQNGSVAKEFLGAGASSDATPLDTDVSVVTADDVKNGNVSAIGNSIANGYGLLLFVLKDHGRFQRTEQGSPAKVEEGKRELFKTGMVGERHYGIRTGFATTEIDFMIAKEDITRDSRTMEKMFFEIAQNGYYIPVTDTSGKVIFTPEMYDEYRESFAGLEKFDAPALDYYPTTAGERSYKRVAEIIATIPKDTERVGQVTQTIRSEIEQALGGLGVSLRPEFDTSILGAELLDTGSTGRHTNTPGYFDFDFSLKLDAKDFSRSAELAQTIKGMMTFTEDNSHQEAGGYYQLRIKGVTSIGGQQLEKPIDIDIGFASKSDLSVYGSHDAIRDKLNYIKNHNGQQAYEQTIANVILTKQTLKEAHAYKKLEDGGFGGVGVENWILANGGNMEEAFKSFRDAAYENGQRLPYERFKEKYKILDPGTNIKFKSHDNFIEVLKPNGYEAMLNTVENYLNKQMT